MNHVAAQNIQSVPRRLHFPPEPACPTNQVAEPEPSQLTLTYQGLDRRTNVNNESGNIRAFISTHEKQKCDV